MKQTKARRTAKGRIIKRGKLKLWTGKVPPIPLAVAIASQRQPRMTEAELLRAFQTTSTGGTGLTLAETRAAIREGRKGDKAPDVDFAKRLKKNFKKPLPFTGLELLKGHKR